MLPEYTDNQSSNFHYLNQMEVDNMSFQWKVSPQMRTNPPPPSPFHSTSNPHTMQAKDCVGMCTQVMEAKREETLLLMSVSVWFTTLLRSQTMHHKQRSYLVNPWDTADIVSADFDLILLIGDPGLNHIAGGRQAHTWEGWAAFLGTEWCVLRLKPRFFLSNSRLFWFQEWEESLQNNLKGPFPKQLLAIFGFMGIQKLFFCKVCKPD